MKRCTQLAVLIAWLALGHSASAAGLVVDDPSAAVANAKWISDQFAQGQPVTLPAASTIYTATINTPATLGCGRLKSDGSLGIGGFGVGHPLNGGTTRIVHVGDGPFVRLCGTGFVCEDPITWIGSGSETVFEVEGREQPPTGHHRFRNQIFYNCGAGFKCLPTPDENHADNCTVECCEAYNCERFFWSLTQQSVPWSFRDTVVCYLPKDEFVKQKDCIIADVERGGWLTFDGLTVIDPHVTLLRIRDYSPNNCSFVFRRVLRDRFLKDKAPDNFMTLVEYTGPKNAKLCDWSRWKIDIDAVIQTYAGKGEPPCNFDKSRLYKVPADLPRDGWRVKLDWGLPNQ